MHVSSFAAEQRVVAVAEKWNWRRAAALAVEIQRFSRPGVCLLGSAPRRTDTFSGN